MICVGGSNVVLLVGSSTIKVLGEKSLDWALSNFEFRILSGSTCCFSYILLYYKEVKREVTLSEHFVDFRFLKDHELYDSKFWQSFGVWCSHEVLVR